MFRSFAPEVWDRRGTASGEEFTVREMPAILIAHEIYNREILRKRYLDA